jgi:hypothetical protein
MLLRYRLVGDADWSHALTENVSRTGLLFRTDSYPLPATGTARDVVLDLSSRAPLGLHDHLEARGTVARLTDDPKFLELLPGIAVSLAWRDGGFPTEPQHAPLRGTL